MAPTKTKSVLQFKRQLDYLDVHKIEPNPSNPREALSKQEIADIKESIRLLGAVLVPIVVYQEDDGRYILLDGERRWRACLELLQEDPKYADIPANIIEKPLSEIQNVQTMFNIHQRRKEWSTAAKAAAIGRLQKLRGHPISVQEICQLTSLKEVNVTDALLLLKFPKNVLDRCLEGELDEFYPILLGRNLRSLEKTFPEIFKKYDWSQSAEAFMKKVDMQFIQRARDFNKIGQMAKICIIYQSEPVFDTVYDKMISDLTFTPRIAQKEVERRLGYETRSWF